MNPFHNVLSYFCTIRFSIILRSKPMSCQQSRKFKFPKKRRHTQFPEWDSNLRFRCLGDSKTGLSGISLYEVKILRHKGSVHRERERERRQCGGGLIVREEWRVGHRTIFQLWGFPGNARSFFW